MIPTLNYEHLILKSRLKFSWKIIARTQAFWAARLFLFPILVLLTSWPFLHYAHFWYLQLQFRGLRFFWHELRRDFPFRLLVWLCSLCPLHRSTFPLMFSGVDDTFTSLQQLQFTILIDHSQPDVKLIRIWESQSDSQSQI